MKQEDKREFTFELRNNTPCRFKAHAVTRDDTAGMYQITNEEGETVGEITIADVVYWTSLKTSDNK